MHGGPAAFPLEQMVSKVAFLLTVAFNSQIVATILLPAFLLHYGPATRAFTTFRRVVAKTAAKEDILRVPVTVLVGAEDLFHALCR